MFSRNGANGRKSTMTSMLRQVRQVAAPEAKLLSMIAGLLTVQLVDGTPWRGLCRSQSNTELPNDVIYLSRRVEYFGVECFQRGLTERRINAVDILTPLRFAFRADVEK